MRVLHVYKTYFPDTYGGGPQVIFELCEGGAAHGVRGEVFTTSRTPRPATIQIGRHFVHRVRLNLEVASTSLSWSAFRKFRELAAAADVVHYHFPWPFMDILDAYADHGKPTVVTYHSDIVAQRFLYALYRPLMLRFLEGVDRIVATSPAYAQTSEVLRQFSKKVSIIPIGVAPLKVTATAERRKEYWKSTMGKRFFLFIGVFRYYKSLEVLIEAAKDTNMVVALVGDDPKNIHPKPWMSKTANFHILGALPDDDKIALLSLCTGLILPSSIRSEAFGISLLEGAMFGKPLISCEIGTGTSFININGQTGLVVPPNDPQALRSAMSWIWNQPAKAEELGCNAMLRYQRLFTQEHMTAQYCKLYRDLCQDRMATE